MSPPVRFSETDPEHFENVSCRKTAHRVQSPSPELRGGTTASANEREIIMVGNKTFITLPLAAALGVLGVASAAASEHGSRGDRGGFVMPGSLVGVNPVYH